MESMNGLSESKGPFLCYHGGRRKVRREQSEQKGTNLNKTNQDKDKEKEKDNDNDKDNDSLSSTEPRLTAEEREKKPSLEEVMSFSQEAGLNVDVQYFYNYYEANGWYIGKRPMKDWKAAVRSWESNGMDRERPVRESELSDVDRFRAAIELHRMKEAKEV